MTFIISSGLFVTFFGYFKKYALTMQPFADDKGQDNVLG
jgi:hypothetical protein